MSKKNQFLIALSIILLIISGSVPTSAGSQQYIVQMIGSSGSDIGQFNAPSDVTLINDNFYVADQFNNRIQVFDMNWNFLFEFDNGGQLTFPYAVVTNGTHLFVPEFSLDRISIFDLSGNFIQTLGSSGSGNGQLDSPNNVLFHEGLMYVTEGVNNRVSVFNESTLGFVNHVISSTSNPAPGTLHGMDIEGDILYVADSTAHRIRSYNIISGQHLGTFGVTGYDPGQLYEPWGLEYVNGYLLITSRGGNRLSIFDTTGTLVEEYTGEFDYPYYMEVTSQYLYIGELTPDQISQSKIVADPTNVEANAGIDVIQLSWEIDESYGMLPADSYRIYRDSGAGYTYIGETLNKYFADGGITKGENYKYQVEAISIIGSSAKIESNSVQVSEDEPITVTVTSEITVSQDESDEGIFSNVSVDILPILSIVLLIPILKRYSRSRS